MMAAIFVINDVAATRTVTDGVTNTDTSLVSATAAFTSADVGRSVHGTGITEGTCISSVTNGTTVVLTSATTATNTGVSVTIGGSRAPTDVVTNSTTAITSAANADFRASDVGMPITGSGIPAGAYIASVTSATAATLSVAATASATITATIGAGLVAGDRTAAFNGVAVAHPHTGSTVFKTANGVGGIVECLLYTGGSVVTPVLLNTANLGRTQS